LIIDLDGVLVNRAPAIQRQWSGWATAHQLDVAQVVPGVGQLLVRAFGGRIRVEVRNGRQSAEPLASGV